MQQNVIINRLMEYCITKEEKKKKKKSSGLQVIWTIQKEMF